jgi:hypothetical protein
MLDISHEVIHNSEPERRTARSATRDVSEKGPKSDKVRTSLARRKRGFNDLEPTGKASKSRKIGPSKTSGNNRRALKAGSKGRDKANSPQTLSESFMDLTEISQKIIEPADIHRILTERSGKQHHDRIGGRRRSGLQGRQIRSDVAVVGRSEGPRDGGPAVAGAGRRRGQFQRSRRSDAAVVGRSERARAGLAKIHNFADRSGSILRALEWTPVGLVI